MNRQLQLGTCIQNLRVQDGSLVYDRTLVYDGALVYVKLRKSSISNTQVQKSFSVSPPRRDRDTNRDLLDYF